MVKPIKISDLYQFNFQLAQSFHTYFIHNKNYKQNIDSSVDLFNAQTMINKLND